MQVASAASPFGSDLSSSQQQFGGSALVWNVWRMGFHRTQFYCLMSGDESLGLADTAHISRMMFGMASRDDASDVGWTSWDG